jgi:hypothetical protein
LAPTAGRAGAGVAFEGEPCVVEGFVALPGVAALVFGGVLACGAGPGLGGAAGSASPPLFPRVMTKIPATATIPTSAINRGRGSDAITTPP